MKKYDVANFIDNPYELDEQEEGDTLFDVDNCGSTNPNIAPLATRPHASSYFSFDGSNFNDVAIDKTLGEVDDITS